MPATPQSLDLKLWTVLARAFDAVRAHAFAHIEKQGLTPSEFGVIESLHHNGPMLVGDLQHRVLVSSGGITYLTDRLVKRGLVERRDNPDDRRTKLVAITRKGRALMDRIFPAHAAVIERALAGVDPDVKQAAVSLLKTIGLSAASVPIDDRT